MKAQTTHEMREHDGIRELHRAFGRIRVRVWCPFCGTDTDAFLWSLAGSGKRCSGGCGAVLGQTSAWRRRKV